MSQFLHDRRQHTYLDGKVSVSVDGVSGVPQGSILGRLLFILYISELFHIVGNHFLGNADDSTIYAVSYS